MSTTVNDRDQTRARVVEIAAQLLRERGPSAVTTRGVAQAAGVQAPTLYRLFGDKDGLLEAVAEHAMAGFASAKTAIVEAAEAKDVDPLDDLRAGWQAQIEFGLTNPDLFRLLSDPNRVAHSAAAAQGRRALESRIRRVARTGRLRVSERRAVGLIQAGGIGVIQTMLGSSERDAGLPDAVYEAVLGQILTDRPIRPDSDPMATTIAFRALAPQLDRLSGSERQLLIDWLDRAIGDQSSKAVSDSGQVG